MRILVSFLLIAFTSTIFSQTISEENINGLVFKNLFDASNNEAIACYRIPALATAPNGDVIAAIDERVPSCGDLKWSKDINIVIRRSQDQGKTWTDIESLVNLPLGESASDPSFIVDYITQEIFLFYNYMNLEKEKDVYYLYMMKSKDNGKTWSQPLDITSQVSKPEWKNDFKFITSGRGIQTNNGTLLHTIVNLENKTHVFGSKDHGKTWFLAETPVAPGDESKIVELSNGSWMVNSRVNKDNFRYVHISEDEGKTWISKKDSNLVDAQCNASILNHYYENSGVMGNMLLFSNANSNEGRKNLTLKVSYDDGKTWTIEKTIYKGGAAYSSLVSLSNGNIGLFFEKDNYIKNVFVEIPISWILSN